MHAMSMRDTPETRRARTCERKRALSDPCRRKLSPIAPTAMGWENWNASVAHFFLLFYLASMYGQHICVCVIVQSVHAAGGVYNCLIPTIDFACTMEYV